MKRNMLEEEADFRTWIVVVLGKEDKLVSKRIAALVRAVRAEERERCAKVAEAPYPFDISVWRESTKQEMTGKMARSIAAAIRRG
jgi:hypothetical protein